MEARMTKLVTKAGEERVVGSGVADDHELPSTARQCMSPRATHWKRLESDRAATARSRERDEHPWPLTMWPRAAHGPFGAEPYS